MRDPFNFSHDHVGLFDFLLDFCSFPFQVFKLGDDAVCLFVYCYERMSVCSYEYRHIQLTGHHLGYDL